MAVVPNLIFIGEDTPIRITLADEYDTVSFFAAGSSRSSSDTISADLTLNTEEEEFTYEGEFKLKKDASIGEWRYQIWVTKNSKKKLNSSGVFNVAPTLDIQPGDIVQTKSYAEVRLDEVEEQIRNITRSGVSQSTVGGNTFSNLTLNQLRKERLHWGNIVNKERRAKGLAYLPGTHPSYISTFMD